ncbi:Hypothetical predicted protein [Mytilus galloprovincialis]|uniref:Cadherin domain-containing protein n=1 Tax=Mytilus galloprovincialis TaxID=29158 RepID=A0A8B6G7U1_MYTGA|nr:Hypothetical predicted protein [Mytilus galloprovincialis]
MANDYAYMEGCELQTTKSIVWNISIKQRKQEINNQTFKIGPNDIPSIEKATHLGIIRTTPLKGNMIANVEEKIKKASTYSLLGGGFHGHNGDTTKFQLNGASLELKSSIDVDTEANQWSIEITVNDATPHIYATPTKIYVFVVITGIDDNVPVWHTDHNGIYTASIVENSAVGTLVQTITATDVDEAGTADSAITYGIETVTSLFGIEAETGKIYISTTSLDRETASSHVLTISAYSSTMTASKITGSITITLTDENDVTPTFTQLFRLPPSILASDTDVTGVNSQITYVLTGGHTTTGCEMSVNSGTGVISLTNNLDYENEASCTVIIEARDGGTPNLVGTATAIITVTPVNEFTPSFTGLPYSKDVSEDTAIDGDTGINGQINYGFVTGNTNSDFSIAANGDVTVANVLSQQTYDLEIQASDQAAVPKRQLYMLMSLLQHLLLYYSTRHKRYADDGLNSNLLYTLTAGNTANAFRLDGAVVEVNSALDYETTSQYILVIEAKDQGTPPDLHRCQLLLM